jgi:hypothetical protein
MNYADLAEEHKTVIRQLPDADKQLVVCMQQIQSLNWDKEWKPNELDELETAAHALVEMVDPTVDGHTLLEHLYDAPRSIAGYTSGTAKVVLAHVLALVKSYVPSMNMKPLVDGAAAGCTKEQFNEYHQEVDPVACKLVDDMQDDLF